MRKAQQFEWTQPLRDCAVSTYTFDGVTRSNYVESLPLDSDALYYSVPVGNLSESVQALRMILGARIVSSRAKSGP